MYIESVPNRNSPPAILLRESYRELGKVRKRTLCNLFDWPTAHIEGLRGVLKGGTVIAADREAFTVTRSLPHGHAALVLGTARKIGLDSMIGPAGDRRRDLVLAMIDARIIDPGSKLAAARALAPETGTSSLGTILGLGEVDEDELYTALDWLRERQPGIETAAIMHFTGTRQIWVDIPGNSRRFLNRSRNISAPSPGSARITVATHQRMFMGLGKNSNIGTQPIWKSARSRVRLGSIVK
jgi:hypothetical protein